MPRVLIVCNDRVGKAMAGPGIRCWEMARALVGHGHDVRLTSPYPSDRPAAGFDVLVESPATISEQAAWAEVIVVQGFVLSRYPTLAATDKHLVVDIYDPFVLETLEMYGDGAPAAQRLEHWPVLGTMLFQLQLGDFFLCANDRQRDFWLGALMALDRVNPETHAQDPILRRLIDIVPFGAPNDPPRHSGQPAVRGVLPGFDDKSRIAIWGGGIYKWFDPLSLIRAWPRVLESVPEARLVITGVRHPTPITATSDVGFQSMRLSEELGLRDRFVHFTDGWVPYDRRQDYLLESDVGVSIHHHHLETRLSFRTRYLDYIWAGLPIIGTEGDWFAGWVAEHRAGRVVPYNDAESISRALIELLGDDRARQKAATAVRREQRHFTWEVALEPLVRYCADPWRAADRAAGDRIGALRNEHLLRLFAGAEGMAPPPDIAGKALWYWRREGTIALARRAAARARRRVKVWRAGA